jgi:rhamnosyltransferase
MTPRASAIVRVKDEREPIKRALASLRSQSVDLEIVVVDSGSTDGTLAAARPLCDRLIEIAPDDFSYGGALNIGAEAASTPYCLALSAHCVAPDEGWVERSLALYENPSVVATNGALHLADGSALRGTFLQDWAYLRAHPFWGFSNHASSWRRDVWKRFPFSAETAAAEDKEWSARVLRADANRIAYRADLMVSMEHRWKASARTYHRRLRNEARAMAVTMAEYADVPPYGLRELARDWWHDLPQDRHSATAHRFLNRVRLAGLLGHYRGMRDARRSVARG